MSKTEERQEELIRKFAAVLAVCQDMEEAISSDKLPDKRKLLHLEASIKSLRKICNDVLPD